MAGVRERVLEPRARSLALTLHADWVMSRLAALALEQVQTPDFEGEFRCWLSREFAMAQPSKRSSVSSAVVTGLSSAAAGGTGGRMFEAKPSLRPTRPMRAAQGTAQRPWLRLAFSWATFFWRSKRKQIGRRAETRLATKEKSTNKEVQFGRRAETRLATKENPSNKEAITASGYKAHNRPHRYTAPSQTGPS
jgi:hypothetical protein